MTTSSSMNEGAILFSTHVLNNITTEWTNIHRRREGAILFSTYVLNNITTERCLRYVCI